MADSYHNLPVAKACSNCARAKAKCDGVASTGKCSRCTRLEKQCVPQQAVRKRKIPRIRRSEQIAQLQDKVNGLLSMVGSGQQLPREQGAAFIPSPASLVSQHSRSGSLKSTAHSQGLDTPSSSSKFPTQFVHLPAGKVATPSTIVPHQSLFEASVPFLHNSDILLSIFRDRLTPLMPFVVIPSHITAEDLHRDKPTAYMAIMLASSYRDITMQLDLARLLLKYLATKVVLEGRKSLDILQGLLIHISCCHYICHLNYQTNNFLGFLYAQLVELGIKRVSAHNDVHESFAQIARRAHHMSDRGMSNCGKQLSMDEKRAFLGCYYLSSCLSLSTSRLDCMAFPSYIQDCCNDLEAGSQSSDTYLVYLMKLQSLVERQRLGGLWDFGDQDCLRAPIGFQVRTYQLELQSFKLSLPAGYITNPLFSMNYYAAEICLYEVGFKFAPSTGLVRQSLQGLGSTDILYACFQATRSWFEAYFTVPAAEYCTLSLVNFGQLFHAIGALHKLSVFDIPEWDTAAVRNTLDLSSVISKIIVRLQEAEDLYTEQAKVQDSPWTYCVEKLRHCKTCWDMSVAQETNAPDVGEGWAEQINEEMLPFVNFEALDDYFWQTMDNP